MADSFGHFQNLESQEQTPVATITAEVNQTAAGAWRGSVKVSVVAPITLLSSTNTDRRYEDVFAEISGSMETDGEALGVPEVSIKPLFRQSDPDNPIPLITSPSDSEYELREAVFRMLADTGSAVRGTVEFYNGAADIEVKVKTRKGGE